MPILGAPPCPCVEIPGATTGAGSPSATGGADVKPSHLRTSSRGEETRVYANRLDDVAEPDEGHDVADLIAVQGELATEIDTPLGLGIAKDLHLIGQHGQITRPSCRGVEDSTYWGRQSASRLRR